MTIIAIIYAITIVVLGLLYAYIQNFSRKPYVFGRYLPDEISEGKEARGIVRAYKLLTIALTLILLLVLIGLLYITKSIRLATIFICLCPFIYIIPLLWANHKIKSLASKEGVKKPGKKLLISTELAKNKLLSGTGLLFIYALGLVLIILTSIVILLNYDKFPDQLIMNIGFAGEINRVADKSYGSLLTPSLASFITWFVFLIANIAYLKSKQALSLDLPEESLHRLIQARRIWTFYYGILCVALILTIQLGVPYFMASGKSGPLLIPITVICILAVVLQIFLASKVGVDGSKLTTEPGDVFTGDEQNWLLAGLVYYNPEDPAVFVYRRLGAGVTVNVASTLGKVFIAFFALVMLVSIILLFTV